MWRTWFFVILICKSSALAKECREDEKGLRYEGTENKSSYGYPCLPWKSRLVQNHFKTQNDEMLKENYCRNPDGQTTLWCFVKYNSSEIGPQNSSWEIGKLFCDVPFCVEASYEWNGMNEASEIQLTNSTEIQWMKNNETGTTNRYIIRIGPLSSNTSSQQPRLKLPFLQSVSTGSCLQLEYRSTNLKLELKTTSKTLTLLPNSSEWKFVNVNIRPEEKNYQVLISPVSTTAFLKLADIKYIRVQEGYCKECFPCFNDGLCIEESAFCDVMTDCPDFSDENNCAKECFFENYYAGFRNETISFDPCTNDKCSFNEERFHVPGCVVEDIWTPCNLQKCEHEDLKCTFVENFCGWKQWKNGLNWTRIVDESTGQAFVFPDDKKERDRSILYTKEGDRSILYSTPQPPSTEYSCLTLSYSGKNSHLEVFITNGTMLSRERKVFQHLNIQSDDIIFTSFQIPIKTAFMIKTNVIHPSSSVSTEVVLRVKTFATMSVIVLRMKMKSFVYRKVISKEPQLLVHHIAIVMI